VTANDKSKTYGQANPAFDAVVTGAVNKDGWLHAGDGSGPDDRRRQLPDRGDAGQQPNYEVTKHDGTLTIRQGVGVGDGQRQEQDLRQANRRSMRR
jgi:hypothetical protein